MQVARGSHVQARGSDLPAPWSLTRPARRLPAAGSAPPVGAVLPEVVPGSPGVTDSQTVYY